MATVPGTRLYTAEDLGKLPESGKRYELSQGELIPTMPPGGLHGVVAGEVYARLREWARSGPGGYVAVESGFILQRDPDTVRGPDVSYVRAARAPATGVPRAFWELAPDLAVEVVSPDDTAAEIRRKDGEDLAAGTPSVWVVYPDTREVVLHTPDGLARTLRVTDTLTDEQVLPGFACPVAELFE